MADGGQQGQCEGMRGKPGTGARCSGFQEREMPEKEESYVQFMAEPLVGFLLRESKPANYLSGLRVGRVNKNNISKDSLSQNNLCCKKNDEILETEVIKPS